MSESTRRWPSSLRARLTLWYMVILALPLVGFALVCYLVFARSLQHRSDQFIGDALTAFSNELTAERRTGLPPADAMRRTAEEVRFRDLEIVIVDEDGRVAAITPHPDSALGRSVVATFRSHEVGTALALTVPGDSGNYRIVASPMIVEGRRYGLAGAYALRDNERMLSRILGIFLIAIPLLLVAAATGGYLLAKRSLAPVASMAAHAAAISSSNLDERLPVRGGDELIGLARVVNGLLDRLEHAFSQQRRFVADASHELRTPTAILRAEAEITLSRPHRTEEEYRASVGVMQDAARRLGLIVDELFLLARADAGHLVVQRETLYLEDVVHDTVRVVQAIADARGVRIGLGALVEAEVEGDAGLLGRLLLNLIDNAIKHSPDDATVEVSMRRRDGFCEISVLDQGPGIPPEARGLIFDRFFRGDTARSRAGTGATSGAGLGLAISRQIADLHAGRLELAESRPGRTEFRLTLPLEAGNT